MKFDISKFKKKLYLKFAFKKQINLNIFYFCFLNKIIFTSINLKIINQKRFFSYKKIK